MEDKLEAAKNNAAKYLIDAGYDLESDPDLMDRVFLKAIKSVLNGEIDAITLGEIANAFEANPAIHLCLYKTEIYLAIDIPHYSFQYPDRVPKIVAALTNFFFSLL